MRYKALLIMLILGVAGACLYLWLGKTGELSSFGLNAFTETLGILFTVLIVDQLITRQEQARLRPFKAAAYEDVRLMTSRIVGFWTSVFKASVPESSPNSVDELFSERSFEKMHRHLNMDAKPLVTPPRTWWEWIPENWADHRNLAERILERHNQVLDAEIYGCVHQIATEGINLTLIPSVRQSDTISGFPRPSNLRNWHYLPEGYCQAIVKLVTWCKTSARELRSAGVNGILDVGSEIGHWEANESPPSKLPDIVLLEQLAAVERHRAEHERARKKDKPSDLPK